MVTVCFDILAKASLVFLSIAFTNFQWELLSSGAKYTTWEKFVIFFLLKSPFISETVIDYYGSLIESHR